MAKRRVYNGVYKRSNTPHRQVTASKENATDQSNLSHMVLKYTRMAYSIVVDNYVTIVTVVVVLLALLVLFPHTHKKNDLDAIKKVLDHMTEEVTRAEDACVTAAEDICNLRCSICDRQTETTQELRDISICTSRRLFEKRSEPVQVEKKIGFFRRIFSLNRNVSRKEIAIMSIVYTESFGALDNLLMK
ncbi:unnamed protein product [Euphydryas editha]|uniref:Uncharacterized protein n=2 Tax=Euphydryas editha TaxID=104508 RepID=A0AAU9V3W1_EUPED|nr:unnamed protein product [Euphydryas editha]